jgi:hypothetical protein
VYFVHLVFNGHVYRDKKIRCLFCAFLLCAAKAETAITSMSVIRLYSLCSNVMITARSCLALCYDCTTQS